MDMKHLQAKWMKFNRTQKLLIIIILLEFIFILNFKIVIGSGNSMSPTIGQHQVLLCKYSNDYKEGDIIYYELNGIPIVHRIIEINEYTLLNGAKVNTYKIKGDNNPAADAFEVYKENIKCKIVGVK